MNRSIFWRVFWKEYRLQRPLWLAMAVLTTMLMLLVVAVMPPSACPPFLLWIALGLSAAYFLGCGATLFAGEREAETFEFQRALPVRVGQVFLGKMTFGLASGAVLLGATWLLAFVLGGRSLEPVEGVSPLAMLTILGFFGIELFLWAVLYSLQLNRVLVAAVLAMAAASFSVHVLAWLVDPKVPWEAYFKAMPWRVGLAALVAAADCWSGLRWFRVRGEKSPCLVDVDADSPTQATVFSRRVTRPDWLAMLGRLVWQHVRQSAFPMVVISVVLILLATFPSDWLLAPEGITFSFFRAPLLLLALLGVPLLGLCAFSTDQRQYGFRFLTERGVPPKHLWLSRQLVAWAPVLVVLPVFLIVGWFLAPMRYSFRLCDYIHFRTETLVFVLSVVVLGIAAGQLYSMFFHSSLLAGVFSVLSGTVLTSWCLLMVFWQVPWFWSILPIPVAMLLATRLRTAGWLLERNTPRAWFWPALTLGVSAAALLTAVPLYRIYQIPNVSASGFSLDSYAGPMTSDERATLDLYRRSVEAYIHAPYAAAKQEAAGMLVEASRQELQHPFDGDSPLDSAAAFLLQEADELEEHGKLDAALEDYLAALRVIAQMYRCDLLGSLFQADRVEMRACRGLALWAGRPGQTPERILAADRQIRQINSHFSLLQPAALEYTLLRRVLDGDMSVLTNFRDANRSTLQPFTQIWLSLPWERERAKRLLDLSTCCQLAAAGAGAADGEQSGWHVYRKTLHNAELPYSLLDELSLPAISHSGYDGTELYDWSRYPSMHEDWLRGETARRALQVILALEAWKLEHGSLPERLDELVGHGLDSLPLDPYAGVPFRYVPEGLETPLPWRQSVWHWYSDSQRTKIPAKTPFLWSQGPRIRTSGASDIQSLEDEFDIDADDYWIPRPTGHVWRRPTCELDVWASGWAFPIP